MTSFFYDKVGEYFGHNDDKCPCREEFPDFVPGLLANVGVIWISFFDELLIPDEIRKARRKCKPPCCGKPNLCPPIKQKPSRPSCRKDPFPKSSCF